MMLANIRVFSLFIICILLSLFVLIPREGQCETSSTNECANFVNFTRADDPALGCKDEQAGKYYYNLPLLKSVYCYNNGSGLCKGLSGRFEFHFNTFKDELVGPVGESQQVDKYGLHRRVPVAYDPNGRVLYHDRTINWARKFVNKQPNGRFNLLYKNDLNWCKLAAKNYWPYTAAVKDLESDGRYHIYFFNRQTCIYNTNASTAQLENSRFAVPERMILLDLEMNPVMFLMEVKEADKTDVHLAVNKHQYWTLLKYQLKSFPDRFSRQKYISYTSQVTGNTIRILSKKAYAKYSNICMTDYLGNQTSPAGGSCGTLDVETAEYHTMGNPNSNTLHETSIFGAPVDTGSLPEFNLMALFEEYNGLPTALTTVPSDDNRRMKVIVLMALFNKPQKVEGNQPSQPVAQQQQQQQPSNSFVPRQMLAQFDAEYEKGENRWTISKDLSQMKNNISDSLNHVDDFAYLHACKTILVVYGPLYTEMKPDTLFSTDSVTKIGSIDKLGLFESTKAFFAQQDTKYLYFYHRTNYIARHEYTCGSNDGLKTLVTAKKVGNYRYRRGANMFDDQLVFKRKPNTADGMFDYYEERFFKDLDVFKGDAARRPDAPDPRQWPLNTTDLGVEDEEKDVKEEPVSVVVLFACILICCTGILTIWAYFLFKFWAKDCQSLDEFESRDRIFDPQPPARVGRRPEPAASGGGPKEVLAEARAPANRPTGNSSSNSAEGLKQVHPQQQQQRPLAKLTGSAEVAAPAESSGRKKRKPVQVSQTANNTNNNTRTN